MSRVRELPIIPLHVRLVLASPSEDTAEDEDDILALFGTAQAFWLDHAGIQMSLVSTLGRGPPDVFAGNRSLSYPPQWRTSLDSLYQAGSTWITAVYVSQVGDSNQTTTNAYDYEPGDYHGMTEFAQPQIGVLGYGCTLITSNATWATLAHELGHALGLPHTTTSRDEVVGARDMAPFLDDTTEALLGPNDVRNLMFHNADDLSDTVAFLTDNQVRRARLTITTRACPYARYYDNSVPPYFGETPLLDDICAPYLAQVFRG